MLQDDPYGYPEVVFYNESLKKSHKNQFLVPLVFFDGKIQKSLGLEFEQDWTDFYMIYYFIASDPTITKMVEIGSFRGKGISYLAYYSRQFKESFELYAVDNFSNGKDTESSFNKYNNNLKILKVRDVIIDLVGDSVEMSKKFSDNYFDFIFVDADHTYESVTKDLTNWWPKLRYGGIIAGHDIGWDSVRKAVMNFFYPKRKLYAREGNSWIIRK